MGLRKPPLFIAMPDPPAAPPAVGDVPYPFASERPTVLLTGFFPRPYDNAVATARTCYSAKGIVTPEQVAGEHLSDPDKRDRARLRRDLLARSIFEAGHHTTLQHAHFQFALTGVSRQFIWSFLHSHPFYNSEQVSQRYVPVKPGAFVVPTLSGEAAAIYERTLEAQMAAYIAIGEGLEPLARARYLERFPARRRDRAAKEVAKAVRKRCMEVARYVLPVATTAYLYHTVSGITLLRYHRLAASYDCPAETRFVVDQMVGAVLAYDPDYGKLLDDPVPLEATPEAAFFADTWGGTGAGGDTRQAAAASAFAARFDVGLEGHTSKLIAGTPGAEGILAEAVREVLAVGPAELSDDDAIRLAIDPARNALLSHNLNLTLHHKLSRAALHVHYTFRKKLSHAADSQDQRHRLTPGSRPALVAHLTDTPDYVTPRMIEEAASEVGPAADAAARFHEVMAQSWEATAALGRLGVGREDVAYLLPNAQSVRFTESGDLLAMRHKLEMRLCFNAQEEIFRASLDEAEQIGALHPKIGTHLAPPCVLRHRGGVRPICPEGSRFCGVKVWRHGTAEFEALRGTL